MIIQRCAVESVDECIRIYGLDEPRVEYEIISIERLSDMLVIRVITEDGVIHTELRTKDLNIATDFVQSQIDKVFYDENKNRVGLWDDEYGYYCMVIPKQKAFEILDLEDEWKNNKFLYDTKEYIVHVLEKEFDLGGGN